MIVIGRNEGGRLRRCLAAVLGQGRPVVYVDSGSTDGSAAAARLAGAEVVQLDAALPFTAARARNAGFERLLARNPALQYAQFVDGDCELVAGWLLRAQREMEARPQAAVVCGRRAEQYPDASIYNRLMDMDWRNTPPGEARACGGDALMRVTAFRQAGGFNPALIAGEEADLCVRLRRQGWIVWQVDAPMSLHDATMMRFGQWWRRSVRTGQAYAAEAWLHGRGPERLALRESRSIWFWGGLLPILTLGTLSVSRGRSAALLAGYGALALRVYRHKRAQKFAPRHALLYAAFCVLGKFPQAVGQARFHAARLAPARGSRPEAAHWLV